MSAPPVGLRLPGMYLLAAGVVAGSTVLGLASAGVVHPWLYLLAMGLDAVAALVLLAAPGDPLRWPATAVCVTLPVIGLVLVAFATTAEPNWASATASGMLAIVFGFVCVRGRVWVVWPVFVVATALVVVLDRVRAPAPSLIDALAPNFAVLLMATFFAAIVRPRARQIYALSAQAERQSAAAAAQQAALAVRDQQLEYLGQRARPLLERISSGRALDADVIVRCGLVEANLRDRIRAPGLDVPEVAAAAWDARARGARVVLLDDHDWTLVAPAEHSAPTELLGPLRQDAVAALKRSGAHSSVTVRILPAGRDLLATIAVDAPDHRSRREFALDGRARRRGPESAP
ncbi:hypothetical protein GOHSU_06_00490 [Gordonia hirsuta DSM 44140 = NBRC 16056]|uniref:Two-component histidine kinase n=1 Tax=Gordonia hirsuta DSM 44140 = NBRC 16056 TaxID=1121927 RepID=L7L8R1_9ACTN|nr:hypothetical protein [Gordonia hirsuta]GAC56437.1 hypothetical protein GOHSU_06_00490 [Gordonia hirsuta DSM 44140 = NBRC 16056]